jgi:hypothetical protein
LLVFAALATALVSSKILKNTNQQSVKIINMTKKILHVVAIIFVLPLPFLGSIDILKKFSPYFDGNSLGLYIAVSIGCGIVSAIVAYYVTNKTLPRPLLYAGASLFIIGISMTSIWGLGAEPDFSPNMLQHPEREHYRYALLFLNALLFAAAFFMIMRNRWSIAAPWHKWIVLLFIPAFAELVWEFQHHFFLGTHLQQWINEGKNAAGFMVDYTPEFALRFGGLGRALQYPVIVWLALILFKANFLKKWVFIVLTIFCVAGCFTGIVVTILGYGSFAKLQALMLFFIPGGPFVLLYWMGLALLSKRTNNK